MNIFCINHEYPPVGGGAATVTRELLSRLCARGHRIVLLTEEVPKGVSDREKPEFQVFRINAGRKSVSRGSYLEFVRFFIKSLRMLRKIHKEFRPDITFAFFTIPGGLLAMIQKWWYGTPYIVSIRGGDMPGFIIDKKLALIHFLSKPLIKLICKQAALIHTNSERLRELTQKTISDIQVNIIPNGVTFDAKPPIRKLMNGSLRILFVGRLSRQKNLDTFLLGISILPDHIKEKVKFTIVGEGPEKQRLEKLVKEHDLSDSVYFQTWADRKDLKAIYMAHTFSVIPSLDEGMPNSALESVISGCPVLGSRSGSLAWEDSDLKKHWIVDNTLDVTEWKNRLISLYEMRNGVQQEFVKMYAFVKQNYNWDSLIDEYENILLISKQELPVSSKVEDNVMYALSCRINAYKWIFGKIYRKYLVRHPTPSNLWKMHPQGDYFIERGGDKIPPPLTCNIVLTNSCNLKCTICPNQNALSIERHSMNIEVFRAIADTLFPVLTEVELNSVGEPLMYPHIEEVFATIKKFGCRFKLQTNATLLKPWITDLLCEQIGEISLSIDATGELFDTVRRGGKWEIVDRNVRELMKKRDPRRLNVQLYPTVTERTLPNMLNILDWAYELGIDKVMFNRYNPFKNDSEVRPTDEAMSAQKRRIGEWVQYHHDGPFVKIDTKLVKMRLEPELPTPLGKQALRYPNHPQTWLGGHPYYICPVPTQYIDIDFNGNVSACCRSQAVKLGSAITKQEFAKVWFGPIYQTIRTALRRNSSTQNPLKTCINCIKDHLQ